ncbi:MAG TPA: ATP-dependent sacrificial sulfur transferase LarE [Gemmatimonadaceae bacterium]|nr:ATP-dependent sacrificial sulfur transferase LarE [Gemmatimonadaceae bacterium]
MPATVASDPLAEKETALAAQLDAHPSWLIAFSGGVDSALLTVVARRVLGARRMRAALGASAAVPRAVQQRAARITLLFDVPFDVIETNELDDPGYVANRGNRCYFCKRELWSRLTHVARKRGISVVADGSIVDDMTERRPGRAAGTEADVVSPLADCGFTKTDVRVVARKLGIPLWNAPASPCLASRVAVGVPVTRARLADVDRAEDAVRALGIDGDLRVRHIGDAARVELPSDLLSAWSTADAQLQIMAAVRGAGFTNVSIDPRGYRRGAVA